VCAKRGVRIFTQTTADEIVEENGAVTVKTARGLIRAGHAVVATNSSIVDRVALHSKTSPYRTYVIGLAIKHGELPDALYWDTEEPYPCAEGRLV
jgi:glycine/D-amino acid oxidase-like deaminating enzyme